MPVRTDIPAAPHEPSIRIGGYLEAGKFRPNAHLAWLCHLRQDSLCASFAALFIGEDSLEITARRYSQSRYLLRVGCLITELCLITSSFITADILPKARPRDIASDSRHKRQIPESDLNSWMNA